MLVKYCEPKFNPVNGWKTLRLGTLDYYRLMDPSFTIADPDEGVEAYGVNYIDGVGAHKECKEYMDMIGFKTGSGVNVRGITFKRGSPNCFIWCCKQTDSEPSFAEGQAISKSYTSFYKIDDAEAFAAYVMRGIYSNLAIEMFSEFSQNYMRQNNLTLKDVKVFSCHGPVTYVAEKYGEYTPTRVNHYHDLPPILRPIFTKPDRFSPNQEYRFVFLVVCPRTSTILTVVKEPFDLPIA